MEAEFARLFYQRQQLAFSLFRRDWLDAHQCQQLAFGFFRGGWADAVGWGPEYETQKFSLGPNSVTTTLDHGQRAQDLLQPVVQRAVQVGRQCPASRGRVTFSGGG